MAKLDFIQAKSKFKNDEDILSYFILVESYEKHLNPSQKEKFLSPDAIDSMINILNEKQLNHLKSLIQVFYSYKHGGSVKDISYTISRYYYGGEGLSTWFINNVFGKVDYENVQKICKNLIYTIEKAINKYQNKNKLINNYKLNLKKFNGDSIEYRQWLILSTIDHGFPGIDNTYDVTKLLKRLTVAELYELKSIVKDRILVSTIIEKARFLEPYFYSLATINSEDKCFKIIDSSSSEYKAFQIAINNLIFKIENIVKEKNEFIGDKIEALENSSMFYEDVINILRSIQKDTDDLYLKDTIAEYSQDGAHGDTFNYYLRNATLLKDLSEGKISKVDISKFKNKILKVREYFLRHITNKEYTVYRGMKTDGLLALLTTSQPKIIGMYVASAMTKAEQDDAIFREINEKHPTVFDKGLVSTSLNEGIASREFGGKRNNCVFWTIKIPKGSKALVLDYEGIRNVPREEEVLLAESTKIKINLIKIVGNHIEVDAEVVK